MNNRTEVEKKIRPIPDTARFVSEADLVGLGKNPAYWFLPLWGEGPNGDGVHWPTAPADGCGSDGEHACDNVHLLDSTCGSSDSESV